MGGISIKTLRGKIALFYIVLTIIITLVNAVSIYNIFKVRRSIDNIELDSYKIVDLSNNMDECIDNQLKAIFQNNYQNSVNLFYDNNQKFYMYFNKETAGVTSQNEKIVMDKLNTNYLEFVKFYSQIETRTNTVDSIKSYNSSIILSANDVKKDLRDIVEIRKKAIIKDKIKVNQVGFFSICFNVLSTLIIIIGFIISIFYINRALKPIRALIRTIQSVKNGDLSTQAPVFYNDEIGTLATEFNEMTRKLFEYEKSSKGSLMAEKNRSLTIVKSIPDPIIVLDVNFRIMLLNNSCENFFNIKENEVINTHFLDSIRNLELYDHVFSVINNLENTEKTIKVSTKGKTYFFNTTVNPIKDSSLGIDGVVILMKNVTELKQLEKIKMDFIDTVSHEFKTPLTSIMIGIELIHDKHIGELNEKQVAVLGTIKEDGEKLSDLVTNLLRLSRIQSDRTIFNIKPCNIKNIIENCCKSYEVQAKYLGIKFNYEQKKLPLVLGDKEKLEWLLNNLVSNSFKHSNLGDVISIGSYLKNNMVHLFVKDTGEGMPSEYRDKVFEKFVQIKSNDYWSGSVGLGLSIAKEIVDAHKGTIWCESELDVGSIFTFTIPISRNKKGRAL